MMLIKYLTRVGLAMSVLLNVLIGGASNQTFSARNFQWKREGKFNIVWLIDYLLGKNHCSICWAYWKVREKKW